MKKSPWKIVLRIGAVIGLVVVLILASQYSNLRRAYWVYRIKSGDSLAAYKYAKSGKAEQLVLIDLLTNDSNPNQYYAAIYGLEANREWVWELSEERIRLLVDGIADPETGWACLYILAYMGERARPHVNTIASYSKSPKSHIRGAVAFALGEIGGDVDETLILLSQDQDSQVFYYAIQSLGKVKPTNPKIVQALIDHLSDKGIRVRELAIEALGNIGPKASPAIPKLKELALNIPKPKKGRRLRRRNPQGSISDKALKLLTDLGVQLPTQDEK